MLKTLPVLIQGLILLIDEFYFHRRRRLRRWERIGHPIDTLAFAACFAILFLLPPSSSAVAVFGTCSVLSCLLITKDEWEHRALAHPMENWLHALLFVLHPVVLGWAALLWWMGDQDARLVISLTLTFSLAFFLYQVFYWNVWAAHDRQ